MNHPSGPPRTPRAPTQGETRPALPGVARIVAGGIGFLLLSLFGILLASRFVAPTDAHALTRFPAWALGILAVLASVDFVLGGLRYRIFFNGRGLPKISLWRCMCANWANMLMGAVTPFQTGGGPAQLAVLWRYGATVSQGLLVSLVTYAATLVFFLVAGVLSAVLLPADLFSPALSMTLRGCLLLVATVAAMVLLLILFPHQGMRRVRRAAWRVLSPLPRLNMRVARLLAKAQRDLDASRQGLAEVLRRRPGSLPWLLASTIALFVNKYVMAFVIARALEATVSLPVFLELQVLQHLMIYYAPTPGASGIASLSAAWIFGEVLSPMVMTTYLLVWRVFTSVIGALLGVPVLLRSLGSASLGTARRLRPRAVENP